MGTPGQSVFAAAYKMPKAAKEHPIAHNGIV